MCAQTLMNKNELQSFKAGQVLWDMSPVPHSLRKKDPIYKGSHQRIDLITEVNPILIKSDKEMNEYIYFEIPDSNGNESLILDVNFYNLGLL